MPKVEYNIVLGIYIYGRFDLLLLIILNLCKNVANKKEVAQISGTNTVASQNLRKHKV